MTVEELLFIEQMWWLKMRELDRRDAMRIKEQECISAVVCGIDDVREMATAD